MTASEHEHVHDDSADKAPVAPRVLLFYDYTCPFCYVDEHRFDRLRAERPDVEFVLVPFELRPDMPEEGYPVSELEAGGQSERVHEHLLRVAGRENIPLQIPPFLPKTHRAHTLAEMGRDRGQVAHDAVHRALFSAYFAQGRDIGDPEVLLDVAEREGFDRVAVTAAWDEGTYDERLHQFRHVAMHLGLDSTPAALICNELVIGSRPYEVLRDALDRCLVHKEALEDEEALEGEESPA